MRATASAVCFAMEDSRPSTKAMVGIRPSRVKRWLENVKAENQAMAMGVGSYLPFEQGCEAQFQYLTSHIHTNQYVWNHNNLFLCIWKLGEKGRVFASRPSRGYRSPSLGFVIRAVERAVHGFALNVEHNMLPLFSLSNVCQIVNHLNFRPRLNPPSARWSGS
jgi:hypothetical protein